MMLGSLRQDQFAQSRFTQGIAFSLVLDDQALSRAQQIRTADHALPEPTGLGSSPVIFDGEAGRIRLAHGCNKNANDSH